MRSKRRNALQHFAQRIRSARYRRWTEGGDAELRQAPGNRGNHIPAVKRVEALQPMNVNVDETGKHDMAAQIFFFSARGALRTQRTCRP